MADSGTDRPGNGKPRPQNRHLRAPWKPGQSGNPAGRPGRSAVARACRILMRHTGMRAKLGVLGEPDPELIAALIKRTIAIAKDDAALDRLTIRAARLVLEAVRVQLQGILVGIRAEEHYDIRATLEDLESAAVSDAVREILAGTEFPCGSRREAGAGSRTGSPRCWSGWRWRAT